MGKKSKKFIEKNEGQHFHLTYRSQRDEAYANDERPSDFVLVPSNRENTSSGKVYTNISDIIQSYKSSSSNDGVTKDHINALGFKNDGYDYEQHLRVMGGGKFIGKDGKFANDPMISNNNNSSTYNSNYTPAAGTSGTGSHSSREGSTSLDLPDDVFASGGELDRNYQAITISAEFMDEDIRAGLFEDEDENGESFETLDDDFIQQVTQEPEVPDFDFDAHMAKLFALSEKSLNGEHTGSSAARGWEKQSAHYTTGSSSINNLSGGELKGHFLKRKYKNKISGISAMNSNYLIEEREDDENDDDEDDDSNIYSDYNDDNNINNNDNDNDNVNDDEEFNKLLENEYGDDQIGYIDDDDDKADEDEDNDNGDDEEDSSNDGDDEDNDDMQQQQQKQSIKKKNHKTIRTGGGVQGTIDVNDEKNELLNIAMEEFLLDQKDSAMYEGVALNDIEAMKLKIMKFRSNIIDDDDDDDDGNTNNAGTTTYGNNKNDKDKSIIQQLAEINIDDNNNNTTKATEIRTSINKNNTVKISSSNNNIDYKREYELQLASQKESAELFPEYVGNIKKALTDFTNDVYTATPHNISSISHTNSLLINGNNSARSVSGNSSSNNINDINSNIKNAFSLIGNKNNNNNTINKITNAQQTTTVTGVTIVPVVTEEIEVKEEGMQGYFENQEYLKNETVRERWDCETVLSTYSTLDNHPTVIRDARSKFKPYQSKHDRYLEQQQQQQSNANNKLNGNSNLVSISDNESIHSKQTIHTKNTNFSSHTHHSVRTRGGTTSALSNQIKQKVQARVAIAPNFVNFRDISSYNTNNSINNSVIDKAQPVSQIINSSISATATAAATQPNSNKNANSNQTVDETVTNDCSDNSKNGNDKGEDEDEDDGDDKDDDNTIMTNVNYSNGNSRRNETKEEKKLRKQMLKAERKEKRSNKKQLKEAFKTELTKYSTNQPSIGNVEKLSVYKYTS